LPCSPLLLPLSVRASLMTCVSGSKADRQSSQLELGTARPVPAKREGFNHKRGHRDRLLTTLGASHTDSGADHRLAGKADGDPLRYRIAEVRPLSLPISIHVYLPLPDRERCGATGTVFRATPSSFCRCPTKHHGIQVPRFDESVPSALAGGGRSHV